MLSPDQIWLAIACMTAVTYGVRVLPFILGESRKEARQGEKERPILVALGPSLLVAIMVVTILPGVHKAVNQGITAELSYLFGIAATLLALKLSKNAGLAVLVGVAVNALIKFL